MYFESLQVRLVENLRYRVQNGEFTERRLARLTGISQPHINNLLKGARRLSPEVADRVMKRLKMSVLDLIEGDETGPMLNAERFRNYREIGILEGRIGPGEPAPLRLSRTQFYAFPRQFLARFAEPQLARLAKDPEMEQIIQENDLVLLDRCEDERSSPTPDKLYYVVWDGAGLIRRVALKSRTLYLIPETCRDYPPGWEEVSLRRKSPLDFIRGRLVWLGRELPVS